MTRRSIFIGAATALICGPAIVRGTSLMPVCGLPSQLLIPPEKFYRRCFYHSLESDLRAGRRMSTAIDGKIVSVAEARRMVAYALAQGWLSPEAAENRARVRCATVNNADPFQMQVQCARDTMRIDASEVAAGNTALAALMREIAAATVDTGLAELRRHPIVQPEWLSLQDAAAYTGYSEQQFSEFVKRGIAPKSVLFNRNARRFKRSDVDAWCVAGAPSAYSSKSDPGAVLR